jgi:hypothetical protein
METDNELLTQTEPSTASDASPARLAGKGRGFAGMDKERQKAIASVGGKAAHARGTAHEFDAEEARKSGKKGGLAVSQDRAHMAEIGRRGGQSRNRKTLAMKSESELLREDKEEIGQPDSPTTH